MITSKQGEKDTPFFLAFLNIYFLTSRLKESHF